MTSGIYILESPSGQYVGSAVNLTRRRADHFSHLKRGIHRNKILQNAWGKYGSLNFRTILICRREDLLLFEQRAIDALRPRYNICRIAGSPLGQKRSIESRAKMSAAQRGKKHSQDTKDKRAKSLIGRKVSQETRQKLAMQKGWKHTDEAKEKMRGRIRTLEHRIALGRSHIGKKSRLGIGCSPETREKISAALRGLRISKEVRARMKEGQRRRRMIENQQKGLVASLKTPGVDYEVKEG